MGHGSLDLAVSLLALQAVNDLPGTLVQVRRALRPDGLFMGCLLGGATLTELRQSLTQAESEIEGGVSPRVAPFAAIREAGGLLQRAGFALPVADADSITVRYANAFALMRDLRAMGMTTPFRTAPPSHPPGDAPADGGDLRRALRRPGRADPRHLRGAVALGMGAT